MNEENEQYSNFMVCCHNDWYDLIVEEVPDLIISAIFLEIKGEKSLSNDFEFSTINRCLS